MGLLWHSTPTATAAVSGRSPSTAPHHRPPLDQARLRTLRAAERGITRSLVELLDACHATVALVARAGSDLSVNTFDGEIPHYTHVGIALRRGSAWRVHHLVNTHEGPEGHLYDQPLLHFFRDDPIEYSVGVLVPSRPLQHEIARVIESPLREALHTRAYSRIAYPYSTRYQNSNQWVAEIIGAAQGGGTTRTEVQQLLAARGLAPSAVLGIGLARQLGARLISRNTRFDDHPVEARMSGRFEFLLESSLRRYVCSSDRVCLDRVLFAEPPQLFPGRVAPALARPLRTPERSSVRVL